jgi:predicted ATP-grasp superfamily ATP-dependent carboligase
LNSDRQVDVLVAGADTRPGLAVARSLAAHGLSVLAVGEEPNMALRSRHIEHALLAPSPRAEPEAYIASVLQAVEQLGIKLIIPTTDSTLLAVDRYRAELEDHTKLAIARSESLEKVVDKRANLRLAKQLGVPCPKQFDLESPDQIPEMIDALGFPIVLKPPGPGTYPGMPSFSFKVLYARDERELRGYIDEHCADGSYPLFQECASGVVHNLCCFAARGELVAIHEYHSLRRLRGVGVTREVVEPIEVAERSAREMLKAVEWDGVAHVAFFVGEDQKKLWYMETNGRIWASVQGSVHAGWDFPYWIYRYFVHGEVPEPEPIRIGSRTCWHRGDLESFLSFLRGGEIPATGTDPTRLQAFGQYLSGFGPRTHSDVFRLSDPIPAVVDHWRLFGRLTGLRRRATGRSHNSR